MKKNYGVPYPTNAASCWTRLLRVAVCWEFSLSCHYKTSFHHERTMEPFAEKIQYRDDWRTTKTCSVFSKNWSSNMTTGLTKKAAPHWARTNALKEKATTN
jgi:hypothetical protein